MLEEEYIKYEKENAVYNKQSYMMFMPSPVFFDEELKDKDKLVYILISSYANTSGQCFASNNRLARQLSTTIKTVSVSVSNLKRRGWVSVKMIYKENSKEIKNRIITFPLMRKIPHKRKKMTKEEIKQKLPDPMYM